MGRMRSRSRTRKHGRGQLADSFLLLADDALAFLHEPDGHGVGDAVGGRLVGVEHHVQQIEVALILLEQRAGEDVAQQQHDADDFLRFHAARDDAFGEVARVGLQRFDAAGFEHRDVVVVDARRLREDLFARHRRQQPGLGDAARPVFAQLGAFFSQVGHQLAEKSGRGLAQCRHDWCRGGHDVGDAAHCFLLSLASSW